MEKNSSYSKMAFFVIMENESASKKGTKGCKKSEIPINQQKRLFASNWKNFWAQKMASRFCILQNKKLYLQNWINRKTYEKNV